MDSQIIIGLSSGIGGAAAGASVCYAVVRGLVSMTMRKYEDLEKKVQTLQDDRVGAIEKRLESVDSHRKCGEHGQALAQMNSRMKLLETERNVLAKMGADVANVVGWTAKLDGKMDRVGQDVAALKAVVEILKENP